MPYTVGSRVPSRLRLGPLITRTERFTWVIVDGNSPAPGARLAEPRRQPAAAGGGRRRPAAAGGLPPTLVATRPPGRAAGTETTRHPDPARQARGSTEDAHGLRPRRH